MIANSIYNQKTLLYAEKYGIVDYKIKNNKLIYYANYPAYISNKEYTIKVVVNLFTMIETRKQLKIYSVKGNNNMYK